MRLGTLHLNAFGPFTDRALEFEDKASFHIVYGPNESGKTSSLRALRTLLYGFPNRTTDNFLHPNQQLQVGGTFETRGGVEKQLVRWKRNKNSLTTPQGEPVPDSEMVSLLGGLKPDMFDRLYGLSHSHLVSGGKALVKVGGRVGESLFAASLGPEFQELANQLKREYEDLWAGRVNAKRPLNECIRRWEEAEREVSRLALSAEAWSEVNDSFQQAQAKTEALKQQLAGINQEWEKNRRLLAAAADAQARVKVLKELQGFETVGELPEGFSQRRLELQTQLEVASKQLEQAQEALTQLESELAELPQASSVLEFSERVETLFKRVGQTTEYTLELPRVEAEIAQSGARIDSALSGLQIDSSKERPELPNSQWRSHARRSAQEFNKLTAALTEQQSRQQKLMEKLALIPESSDEELEEKLRNHQKAQQAARAEAGLDDVIIALLTDIRTAQSSLALELERLPCWTGDLETLKSARIPSLSMVEEMERELAASARDVEQRRSELSKAEERLREITDELEELSKGRNLYTLSDLHSARGQRKELWFEMQHGWQLGDTPTEAASLIDEFLKSLEQTDEIADELMAAGERLVHYEQLQRESATIRARIAESKSALERALAQQIVVDSRWRALWEGSGVLVASPRQMVAWLSSREEILKSSARLGHRNKELVTARERLEAEIQRLSKAVGEVFAAEQGLGAALSWVDQRVEELRQAAQEQRARQTKRQETELEITEVGQKTEQLEKDLEAWHKSWERHLQSTAVTQAVPEDLEDVLERLESLSAEYEKETGLKERHSRLEVELATFTDEVRRLSESLDLPAEDGVVRQVERAQQMLQEAFRREERRSRLQAEMESKKSLVERLDSEREQHATALRVHLSAAKVESAEQAVEMEGKVVRRNELRKELKHLESGLRQHTSGELLDDFVEGVLKAEIATIPGRQEELERRLKELTEERDAKLLQAGQFEEKLKALDGRSQSARAKQKAAEAEAEGRELLDRYVQLSLAERLLSEQMEEYRKKNEGPVLRSAGNYFKALTCGRYVELRTGLDRRSAELVLLAVSDTGREVAVEGLSDGTCDQLFLALRMATIASSGQTLPVIADDILVQFDDRRAEAALKTLLKFSELTQVILFTHLERDFDLAKKLKSKRIDLVEIPALTI